MRPFLFLFTALSLPACAATSRPGSVATDAEAQRIRTLFQQFVTAWNAGDLEAVMASYAGDAVVMAPNVAAWDGAGSIRSAYEVVFPLYAAHLRYAIDEVQVSGTLAVVRFTYQDSLTSKTGGAATTSRGHALTVLQKQPDGSWKWWREIWTIIRKR